MKQLIKNEWIKLRAQKTYVVLSCIVLALVIIVSFFTSVLMTPLNNLLNYGRDMFNESAAYDWAIEQIESDPDSALAGVLRVVFKDPKSEGDKLREQAQEDWEDGYKSSYAEAMSQAEVYDFIEQNQLEEWIVQEIQRDMNNLYRWREIYNGVQSGKYTPEDMVRDYYLFYLLTGFEYTDEYLWFDIFEEQDPATGAWVIKIYRLDDMGSRVECTWSDVLDAVSVYKPVCDRMISEIEQYALTIEPDAYYDQLIQKKQEAILAYENSIAQMEESIKNLDQTSENAEWERAYLELEITHARGMIEDHERTIDAYEYLKEQGASPNSNAFSLVHYLLPSVLESRRYAIKDIMQDELNGDFILLTMANKSNQNHQIRTLDKAIVAIEYAYMHDILPEGMSASGAKDTFVSNLSTASFLISAVTVVLASMILSREFATGTVRLWVIRPKTRTKLLGSKIATLLLYVCGMMAASFVITYAFALINHVIDLFFYGESTLFASGYGVVLGQVLPIPAVAEHLWALIILTLPVMLYAMLCLFISVLTKKGVLGIVCGMLVLMFATDIQALALIVANYTGVFGYALQATVLPYLSMDRLLVTSMDFGVTQLMSGMMENIGDLMGLESMLMAQIWGAIPYVCSTIVGAGVLVVHILLLIWASLFAFKRTQIKS